MKVAAVTTEGRVTWWVELGEGSTEADWPVPNAGETLHEVSGDVDEMHYWDGTEFVPRPLTPEPVVHPENDRILGWETPPAGLHAKVYDKWIEPPHLITDTDLEAPDCALYFTMPGDYQIELSADWPHLTHMIEVTI